MSGQAYEIPSLELARFFAQRPFVRTHEVDFSRGDPLPLCRYCDRPMDATTWARDEACPGRAKP